MTPETGVLRTLWSIGTAATPVASAACAGAPARPAPPPPRPEPHGFVSPMRDQPADPQAQEAGLDPSAPWAPERTGFDPTAPGGGVASGEAVPKRNDYFRAAASCLEGQGYTVR